MSAADIPFVSPTNPRQIVLPPDASEADLLRVLDALGGPPGSFFFRTSTPAVRRLAAVAVTPAHALALKQYFGDWIGMWAAIPVALWPVVAAGDPGWQCDTMGLIRGLRTATELHLKAEMDSAELDRVLEIAVASPQITQHYHAGGEGVAALVAKATTPGQIAALVEACGTFRSVHELFGAMTPSQLTWAKDAWWSRSLTLTGTREIDVKWSEVRYHFLCRLGLTSEEFGDLASRAPGQLFCPPYEVEYSSLRPRVQPVIEAVRAWVATHLGGASTGFLRQHEGAVDFMPLWAVVLTGASDELVAGMMKRLDEKKAEFRAEREREAFAKFLGESLTSNAHGEAILAAMSKATKSKALLQVFTAAQGILAGARGKSGQGPIAWANTDVYAGKELIAAQPDPAAYLLATIATADAASALGLFLAVPHWIASTKPVPERSLEIMSALLQRLDQVIDDASPETVAYLNSSKSSVGDAVTHAWEVVVRAVGAEAAAVPRGLLRATTNARFRRLLVLMLGQSPGQKLADLAAQLAKHASGLVPRRYAEPTGDRPGPRDLNRLYGSPVGFTAATWPRSRTGAPMQHLLTLETRTLADDARRALGDSVAVAVFLAALDQPGEAAVVPLSADAVALPPIDPLVAPAAEGVRLDILELLLPRALFVGGKKTGVLKELRAALDDTRSLLQTDSTSAQWIQKPEWHGPLVAQIDEAFASKLSLGGGSLYVFPRDVVFQSP